ncbi:MAG: AzlD family protein [Pikeienuella sp.]
MTDQWFLILCLATGTFAIRIGGYVLGAYIPTTGRWAKALNALPGSMIAALLAVILVQGATGEWLAAIVALVAVVLTRSLPVTMIAGIIAIWFLRAYL